MRIAVIADTHDRLPESVASAIAEADEIWHLGDVCQPAVLAEVAQLGPSVTVVRGNNDCVTTWPLEVTLQRHGADFRLIHIPPPPTKLGKTAFLLHGHTHIPRDETVGGVRILNPGAVGKANKGAPPSYAWLSIAPDGTIDWTIVLI